MVEVQELKKKMGVGKKILIGIVVLFSFFLIVGIFASKSDQGKSKSSTNDQMAKAEQDKQQNQNDESSKFDDAVYAKIKEKMKRDYPNDFLSQKGVYDMNVEAYKYMKTVKDIAMKKKTVRDYPNDYVSQKGVYDMQVEAKEQMK